MLFRSKRYRIDILDYWKVVPKYIYIRLESNESKYFFVKECVNICLIALPMKN